MLHLYFLRNCHFTNNIHRHIPQTFSRFFTNILLTGIVVISTLTLTPAWAESNVAGEEVTIFADDTFKPAPRDLGGGRFDDSLDTQLQDDAQDNAYDQQDVISIDSDDLWQRIKNGYSMPDSASSLVAHHEDWYSSRPDYIRRMVERSQKYLFHIVEEVEKRGMPTEIALLPMIESAYNPQAYSSGRASGIWQFIPSTGKHFGLKQNWWVDNRRNITIATDAALTYLQKLHAMFGAWDLALAAYNAGEGTVGRAIERNRKLGLPTDYKSLNLPPETKNYVPKLQAIKNLMTNPGDYGLKIQTIANTPYFAKVSAPAQIDAHLAARLAEISDDEFLALNPSHNRPVITSNGEKHELLLPILSAQTFRNNLATYDKPLVSWQTYYAKRGERMDNIATKFGIQVAQLRNVNNLPTQKKIKNSSTILVPNGNQADFNVATIEAPKDIVTPSSDEPSDNLSAKQDSDNIDLTNTESNKDEIEPAKQHDVIYKVKRGENMQIIAKRHGVSVKQIMTSNSLKNNRIKAGQLLTITTTATGTKATKRQTNDKATSQKMRNKKLNSHSKSSHKQIKSKPKAASVKHKRHK